MVVLLSRIHPEPSLTDARAQPLRARAGRGAARRRIPCLIRCLSRRVWRRHHARGGHRQFLGVRGLHRRAGPPADWPHDRSPYVEEWETFDDDGPLPWEAGDEKEEPA
jgi:hypothetical protein